MQLPYLPFSVNAVTPLSGAELASVTLVKLIKKWIYFLLSTKIEVLQAAVFQSLVRPWESFKRTSLGP